MTDSLAKRMDDYAKLTVQVGLNLQKGQRLFINAPLEAAPFVRRVVKQAYENGAERVSVNWHDDETQRVHLQKAPEATLKEVPVWDIERYRQMVDHHDCLLSVTGHNPRAYEGINPERLMLTSRANGEQLHFFQVAQLKGDIHWAIVGVPTAAWAQTVFPDLPTEEAIAKLWEAIFKTVRVDQPDPVQAWREHERNLKEKTAFLNEKRFKTLHYKSAGTDLHIDLHPDHVWLGGSHQSTFGTRYIPNMPTEEVFTAPLKTGVNGTVRSTKPLSLMGNMVEDFILAFENGKVVDVQAKKGLEALQKALDMDEGMRYLGEVALVPHDSPISNLNIIFNNTLYDENASCHLALGAAITMNIKGSGGLSKEELVKKGVNQSVGHTDFMIGSADLDIDGETADGERIPLFRNGNWAF